MFSFYFFQETSEQRIHAADTKKETKVYRKIVEWQCHREVAVDSGAMRRIKLSP